MDAAAEAPVMQQLALCFPPPMTDAQLAASRRLAELVDRARNSFEVQDFARRRAAARRSMTRERAQKPGWD